MLSMLAWILFKAAFVGNGQFLSTFFSARGKNLTSVCCFHALTEPVNIFTPTTARLIGTFHDL